MGFVDSRIEGFTYQLLWLNVIHQRPPKPGKLPSIVLRLEINGKRNLWMAGIRIFVGPANRLARSNEPTRYSSAVALVHLEVVI